MRKPYFRDFGSFCRLAELPGSWSSQFFTTISYGNRSKRDGLIWLLNHVDLMQASLVETRNRLQAELDTEEEKHEESGR